MNLSSFSARLCEAGSLRHDPEAVCACARRRSRLCVRDRTQILVYGAQVALAHVPEDRPWHNLEDMARHVGVVSGSHNGHEIAKGQALRHVSRRRIRGNILRNEGSVRARKDNSAGKVVILVDRARRGYFLESSSGDERIIRIRMSYR